MLTEQKLKVFLLSSAKSVLPPLHSVYPVTLPCQALGAIRHLFVFIQPLDDYFSGGGAEHCKVPQTQSICFFQMIPFAYIIFMWTEDGWKEWGGWKSDMALHDLSNSNICSAPLYFLKSFDPGLGEKTQRLSSTQFENFICKHKHYLEKYQHYTWQDTCKIRNLQN